MQIIVLSMHRSGSSACTRLLNMMGAYIGPEGITTSPNQENPKGFWERRDLRRLDDDVLHALGADWDSVSAFTTSSLLSLRDGDKALELDARFDEILEDLDQHRPWVLKEPRLCLLLPLWLAALDFPVAVIPYRNPLEVAKSLETRNQIPTDTGLALWEMYSSHILRLAEQIPHVFVSYRELVAHPVQTAQRLLTDLAELGVKGLRLPASAEITDFVDTSLYRERAELSGLDRRLSPRQWSLWQTFNEKGAPFPPDLEAIPNEVRLCLKRYEESKRTRLARAVSPQQG
ncbi:MAG: hypothetical protein U0136_21845 [Bdellovibrionota bacterium]